MSLIRNFALHQRLGQTVHKTLPRTRTGLLTTTRATSSSPQPHTSTNKMAEKKKVLIEITSDTVCPWCFIGKRRVEKAMSQFKDKLDFEVKWLPYMLNPNAPLEGVNKYQYYVEKFGAARVAQMMPHMTQVYANEGLHYSTGGLTGNTLDSHRLIEWAGKHGADKQDALVEELFLNYFTQEKYIGDREVLVAAANKVGLTGAAEYLADPNNGRQEVLDMVNKARGIGGVPFFVVNKKYKLSGAQDPAVFADLFEQLAEGA